MPKPDIIIIGAGHNGLVAANYLARSGKSVIVVERRKIVGGACVTEEVIPGARFSTCAYVVSSLRPEIVSDLGLEQLGLEIYFPEVRNFVMGASGEHFLLWSDMDRTVRELERLHRGDASRFGDFRTRFRRFAEIIEPYLLSAPPALSELLARFESVGAIDVWHEFVTASVGDLIDRYFEHELVRGLFMFLGVMSVHAGPYSPGTAYEFSHHYWGRHTSDIGRFGFARGGMGTVTQSLASAARKAGAEIVTGCNVSRVVVEKGVVAGVRLDDGSTLRAPIVVSNADPRRTYLKLIDPNDLTPAVVRRVQQIDMRGTMARVFLLVDQLPHYRGLAAGEGPQHQGFTLLGATPAELQRCWEAQLRRELTDDYPIALTIQSVTDSTLAPPGLHTVTVGVQHVPFELAHGNWDSRRDEFTERVLRSLFRFAPNVESALRAQFTLTPLDLEREYGLTGGNIFHGAMFPNQLFASRPIPGLGGYRTPIKGLYLCGAGTHPGGAVMGAAGHNAAQAVVEDTIRRADSDVAGLRAPR